MKAIVSRSFRYTPSHETDVRKTFERIRREQVLDRVSPANEELRRQVLPLKQRKSAGGA